MTLYIDLKPTLEWVTMDGFFVYAVADKYLRYRIIWYSDVCDLVIEACYNPEEDKWTHLGLLGSRMRHEDVAKAAAQADYERRTAQRFVRVELPERRPAPPYESQYQLGQVSGHNRCLDRLNEIIQTALDRAKEAKDE